MNEYDEITDEQMEKALEGLSVDDFVALMVEMAGDQNEEEDDRFYRFYESTREIQEMGA